MSTHRLHRNFNAPRASWDAAVGERGHTPRRARHPGYLPAAPRPLASRVPSGRCRDDAPSPPGSAAAGETHFLRLSVPAAHRSRGEAGDITQLAWRPGGQRRTLLRTQSPDSCPRPRRARLPGQGIAALPRSPTLPRWGSPSPGSPHPARVTQVQTGSSSPSPSPGSRLRLPD